MKRQPNSTAGDFKDKGGVEDTKFEVPFDIRCEACDKMWARGVRFSALKRRVGEYVGTPVYELAFKCKLCRGDIVARTDPKSKQYVFVEGAYKIVR